MSDTPEEVLAVLAQLGGPNAEFYSGEAEEMLRSYATLLERVVDVADYPDGASHAIKLYEVLAENWALKARAGELEGRLAASRDMVVAREAKIAEMSDALWRGEQR